jgi:hypothetical protein
VHTQVLREPSRTPLLTQDHLDLKNAEVVVDLLLDMAEPMFLPQGRLQRQRPSP